MPLFAQIIIVCTALVFFGCTTGQDSSGTDDDGCVTGDVIIQTREDMEDIQDIRCIDGSLAVESRYLTQVELPNLEQIKGDLFLGFDSSSSGTCPINSLKGFDSLTEIWEGLHIRNLFNLRDLEGFEKLEHVYLLELKGLPVVETLEGAHYVDKATNIIISDNVLLADLEGLEGLVEIRADLTIRNNTALTSLAGLENLESVFGTLTIEKNPALETLDALRNLQASGFGLNILDNDGLTDLAGLENLSAFSGLAISGNDGLVDLSGLETLHSGDWLTITENNHLESLNGLENLTEVYSIELKNNPLLADFSALSPTNKTIHTANISANPALTSLSFLQNFTTVDTLLLEDLPGITSLSDLQNLRQCNSLTLNWNASLADLNGLQGLTALTELYVWDCPILTNLDGLAFADGMSTVSISGNTALTQIAALSPAEECHFVYVGDNPSLTSLEGLESIRQINSQLVIIQNDSLQDLHGLEGLRNLGYIYPPPANDEPPFLNAAPIPLSSIPESEMYGEMRIISNPQLVSLAGLQNLDRINGSATITLNDSLRTIDALSGLTTVSQELAVSKNPQLPYCNICGVWRADLSPEFYAPDNLSDSCGNDSAVSQVDLHCP